MIIGGQSGDRFPELSEARAKFVADRDAAAGVHLCPDLNLFAFAKTIYVSGSSCGRLVTC